MRKAVLATTEFDVRKLCVPPNEGSHDAKDRDGADGSSDRMLLVTLEAAAVASDEALDSADCIPLVADESAVWIPDVADCNPEAAEEVAFSSEERADDSPL